MWLKQKATAGDVVRLSEQIADLEGRIKTLESRSKKQVRTGLRKLRDSHRPRKAYDIRQDQKDAITWSDIAKEVGYCNGPSAFQSAKKFAKDMDLPWPPAPVRS